MLNCMACQDEFRSELENVLIAPKASALETYFHFIRWVQGA
jgi:hypothetical protein